MPAALTARSCTSTAVSFTMRNFAFEVGNLFKGTGMDGTNLRKGAVVEWGCGEGAPRGLLWRAEKKSAQQEVACSGDRRLIPHP